MSAQPIGEYRGCTIFIHPRDPPLYSNSCTPYLRYTIDRVKQDINNYRDKVPQPPPPPEEDKSVGFHRGIEIWQRASDGMYYAAVTPSITAFGDTRAEVEANIDFHLDALDPPEDPEEGLFAQVTAAVKAWVLVNVPDWLLEWGEVVNNWITNVTEEITNVYNYLTENITNVVNNVNDYVTNVYNTTREYITNSYTNVTESITNNLTEIHNHITNIIGVSEESLGEKLIETRAWTVDFFKLMDSKGFLKDPFGYIKAAFDTLIAPWGQGIVKAFWEGLEEGLEE